MRRTDVDADVVDAAMATILEGEATDAQIAAFGVALRAKGETPTELATLVRTMLRYSGSVSVASEADAGPLIDTCGTGGDRSHTFNISTTAALIAAGVGVRVAKHGNRAASSACGSADVLEALGVVIDLDGPGVARCIDEVGMGFCFAQKFHPAMRFAGPARSQIGVPTTFNFLGPLANPAGVKRQVVGVGDPAMAERVAATLAELGATRAMVFFGHDGLDELTTLDTSTAIHVRDGELTRESIEPIEFGLPRASGDDLRGGDATTNAAILRGVLTGDEGPRRDVALLNASAALQVAEVAESWVEGVRLAAAAIDDGRATAVLDRWIALSQAIAGESS
ncbi:MAG: anthranilate phosphoribosyltransferase [Acidimicrobiia bacterium]|nr:anthranilate phosphoribosyltransferase [Acidimicrobiia bacterium]